MNKREGDMLSKILGVGELLNVNSHKVRKKVEKEREIKGEEVNIDEDGRNDVGEGDEGVGNDDLINSAEVEEIRGEEPKKHVVGTQYDKNDDINKRTGDVVDKSGINKSTYTQCDMVNDIRSGEHMMQDYDKRKEEKQCIQDGGEDMEKEKRRDKMQVIIERIRRKRRAKKRVMKENNKVRADKRKVKERIMRKVEFLKKYIYKMEEKLYQKIDEALSSTEEDRERLKKWLQGRRYKLNKRKESHGREEVSQC
jgi:hypothetical protein